MFGRRSRRILAVVIAAAALGSATVGTFAAAPAKPECLPFPRVPWWRGLSHASVTRQVERRYGGDWSAVIGAWRKQLSKLEAISDKGTVAALKARTGRGKTAKVRRIKLRGATLDRYIDNVRKRIAVMGCLAGETEKRGVSISATRRAAKVAALKTEGKASTRPVMAREKVAICVSCHGEAGISVKPTIPNLAGQNELYLIKQLKEFQTRIPPVGQSLGAVGRYSRIMTQQVKDLSDAEIRDLSAHFAGLPACSLNGAAASRPPRPAVAAKCVECHGPYGKNVFLDVPHLAGQKKAYLARQIRSFQASTETRDGGAAKEFRYHYLMSEIAKTLMDSEVEMVSAYFAELGC